MVAPFGELKYLYVGSGSFDADRAFYRDVLKADAVWEFHEMGAKVAAFRLGAGPLVLLADHRPAKSVIQIYLVDDLESMATTLGRRGWKAKGERFEVPDGPCYLFADPTGNEYALLQPDRPDALLHGR